jgi:hypothetical protein
VTNDLGGRGGEGVVFELAPPSRRWLWGHEPPLFPPRRSQPSQPSPLTPTRARHPIFQPAGQAVPKNVDLGVIRALGTAFKSTGITAKDLGQYGRKQPELGCKAYVPAAAPADGLLSTTNAKDSIRPGGAVEAPAGGAPAAAPKAAAAAPAAAAGGRRLRFFWF